MLIYLYLNSNSHRTNNRRQQPTHPICLLNKKNHLNEEEIHEHIANIVKVRRNLHMNGQSQVKLYRF